MRHGAAGNHNVVIHSCHIRKEKGREVEVIESTADPWLLCRG